MRHFLAVLAVFVATPAVAAPVTMKLTFAEQYDGLLPTAHFTFDPASTVSVMMNWGCGDFAGLDTPIFTDAAGVNLCPVGYDGTLRQAMDIHTIGMFGDYGGFDVERDSTLLAWGQDFGAVRFGSFVGLWCDFGECFADFALQVLFSTIVGFEEMGGRANAAGGSGWSALGGSWTAAPIETPLPAALWVFLAGIGGLGLARRK